MKGLTADAADPDPSASRHVPDPDHVKQALRVPGESLASLGACGLLGLPGVASLASLLLHLKRIVLEPHTPTRSADGTRALQGG